MAPLGVLAERHAVDLALAALLAAWLPAARVWLGRRRVFVAAAALLVPLALATPHLTPSLYGDEPFHLIVLDSLAHDHDLDLSNNYDLQHHPYNRIYMTGKIFLHSPVLALLLLPGYLVDGRAGALVVLALAGAALVAVLVRRRPRPRRARAAPGAARRSACCSPTRSPPSAPRSGSSWWGRSAAAWCLVLLARPVPRRIAVTAVAALGIAVKTRLGLILSPLAAVAWWPRRWRMREVAVSGAVLALATAAALAVEALFLGYPLGMRRLARPPPARPAAAADHPRRSGVRPRRRAAVRGAARAARARRRATPVAARRVGGAGAPDRRGAHPRRAAATRRSGTAAARRPPATWSRCCRRSRSPSRACRERRGSSPWPASRCRRACSPGGCTSPGRTSR